MFSRCSYFFSTRLAVFFSVFFFHLRFFASIFWLRIFCHSLGFTFTSCTTLHLSMCFYWQNCWLILGHGFVLVVGAAAAAYPYFHAAHEFALDQKNEPVMCLPHTKFVVRKQPNHRICSVRTVFSSLFWFSFRATHTIYFSFIAVVQSRLNCWILNLAFSFIQLFRLAPCAFICIPLSYSKRTLIWWYLNSTMQRDSFHSTKSWQENSIETKKKKMGKRRARKRRENKSHDDSEKGRYEIWFESFPSIKTISMFHLDLACTNLGASEHNEPHRQKDQLLHINSDDAEIRK